MEKVWSVKMDLSRGAYVVLDLNLTAWCFHTGAQPVLLSDWNYTPTPHWGAFVKDALAGKKFELKKLR